MRTFSFVLVLDLRPSEIEAVADRLFEAGCDDATPSATGGRVLLDFDRDAVSAQEAILSAIEQVESTGLRVSRVEPNTLVTISEIARRVGRSDESVRLLAEGKRGDGSFPRPAQGGGEGWRLWQWAEVSAWFAARSSDDVAERLAEESVFSHLIAAINASLLLRAPSTSPGLAQALLRRLAPQLLLHPAVPA